MACRPMAMTLFVVRSKATIEGSSTTTLSLWMINVLAVPKSMAMSCVNQLNKPIHLNYIIFSLNFSMQCAKLTKNCRILTWKKQFSTLQRIDQYSDVEIKRVDFQIVLG